MIRSPATTEQNDRRPALLFYGNCQAAHMRQILEGVPSLARHFDLCSIDFLGDPLTGERAKPPSSLLARCERLYYNAGETSFPLPDYVLKLIAAGRALRFPVISGNPMWPQHVKDVRTEPGFPWGRFPYGDRILLDLADAGLDEDAILEQYSRLDLAGVYDLDRRIELWKVMVAEWDAGCDVKLSEFVWENWRRTRLFWTIYHPTNELVGYLLKALLARTFGDDVPEQELIASLRTNELDESMTPIHPSVARHLRLEWFSAGQLYNSSEGPWTWEQWVRAYVRYIRSWRAAGKERAADAT